MSNIQRFEGLKQIVQLVQPQFDELAKIHGAVNYKIEASFALQILQDNDYLAGIADGNRDSLKRAVINVAAIGLTLNPSEKLAYLVPRDKKVCLDISYLGYVKLATDAGAIKWAAAEIVRAKDKFVFNGVNREPTHIFDPFEDRGDFKGGYCLAKTYNEEFILTWMAASEILSIRDRSESYKSGKRSPWRTDENEMIKKTLIRRGWKSWPKTDTRGRLEKAIDVINEADPINFSELPAPQEDDVQAREINLMRELLVAIERTEGVYIEHLTRTFNREIKSLEDLTEFEREQSLVMLNQFAGMVKSKEVKNEIN